MNVQKQAEKMEKKQRSLWQEAWRRFKRNKSAMIGLVFFVLLIGIAIATLVNDLVTGNEFYQNFVINQDLASRLKGPSMEHIFGQDEFGRDMLLRMIWAVRYSLFMGSMSIVISLIVGGILGAVSGYYGKMVDGVIMRCMDILLAIPSMLLATAIVAALGTSLVNVLIAIAISYVPTFARTVRASVLTVKDQEFIEAARAIGCHDGEIIFKYIIPNAMAPIIVRPVLPGPGHPAAHPGVGRHALQRPDLYPRRLACHGHPGPGHYADHSGAEPDGRRPAGRAGPQTEGLIRYRKGGTALLCQTICWK